MLFIRNSIPLLIGIIAIPIYCFAQQQPGPSAPKKHKHKVKHTVVLPSHDSSKKNAIRGVIMEKTSGKGLNQKGTPLSK